MSFIERVAIGYFDAAEAVAQRRAPTPIRPVTDEEVERLQAVRDAVFSSAPEAVRIRATEWPLASRLRDGLLWFEGSVTPEAYAVSCAAHEMFGMSAVDVAHGARTYPEPFGERPIREVLMERSHLQYPHLGEAERARRTEENIAFFEELNQRMREIDERVRAVISR
ncbi:MAG TPA: hypothetical protein VF771_09200 [Longimicrobiaceae bacterium]